MTETWKKEPTKPFIGSTQFFVGKTLEEMLQYCCEEDLSYRVESVDGRKINTCIPTATYGKRLYFTIEKNIITKAEYR